MAKRHITTMDSMQILQLGVWFQYLLEKSGCSNAREFEKWLSTKGVVDSSLDNIEWPSYEKLSRSPATSTLLAVENIVPGSMARYLQLHDTIPLISYLNGSTADCERHLLEVLGEFKLYKLNMSLRAKCEAIFKLTVADHLIIDRSKDYKDENLDMVFVGGSHSIEEVMAMSENMVAKSYSVGRQVADTTKFKKGLPLVYGKNKILHVRLILAVLSLIHICLSSNDSESKQIAYYLIDGITDKALEDNFGRLVSEYVKEEF